MTDVAVLQDVPLEIGPRSSVFEKTTPELRRKLDRAIVDYDPPGYLALFKKFGLAGLGVNYQAFYQYARKLRRRAAAQERVQTVLSDEQDVVKSMPSILGQFLIDQVMANDQAAPSAIYRLMLAYTAALNNAIKVHENRHVFAPCQPDAAAAAAIPARGDSRNPFPPTLDACSPQQILSLCDRVVTAQRANLEDDKAKHAADRESTQAELNAERAAADAEIAAEFEKAKCDIAAMGFPVENAKTIDEIRDIIDRSTPAEDRSRDSMLCDGKRPQGADG